MHKCPTDVVFLLHLCVLHAFHLLGVVHNCFSCFHSVWEYGHPEAEFGVSVASKTNKKKK